MENKYFNAALDLSIKYPLTRFISQGFGDAIGTEDLPELYILGFGALGKEVFLSLFRSGVFLDKSLEPRVADCFIFDSDKNDSGAFLDSSVRRIDRTVEKGCEYLPSVPRFFRERFIEAVDSTAALERLTVYLGKSAAQRKIVYLCYEDKELNLALAERLSELKAELCCDFTILLYSDSTPTERHNCFTFGFDFDKEIKDFTLIASLRNLAYSRELPSLSGVEAVSVAEELWHSLDSYGRASSLFAAVSLPFKLDLLGLYIAPASDSMLTLREYLSIYEPHADALCTAEHYRWCSSLISLGYARPTLERILTERKTDKDGKEYYTDGKSREEKLHPHLTDLSGLRRFAHLVAERDGTLPTERDVIGLDRHLLDYAWHMLTLAGLGIYKR